MPKLKENFITSTCYIKNSKSNLKDNKAKGQQRVSAGKCTDGQSLCTSCESHHPRNTTSNKGGYRYCFEGGYSCRLEPHTVLSMIILKIESVLLKNMHGTETMVCLREKTKVYL